MIVVGRHKKAKPGKARAIARARAHVVFPLFASLSPTTTLASSAANQAYTQQTTRARPRPDRTKQFSFITFFRKSNSKVDFFSFGFFTYITLILRSGHPACRHVATRFWRQRDRGRRGPRLDRCGSRGRAVNLGRANRRSGAFVDIFSSGFSQFVAF